MPCVMETATVVMGQMKRTKYVRDTPGMILFCFPLFLKDYSIVQIRNKCLEDPDNLCNINHLMMLLRKCPRVAQDISHKPIPNENFA